ncbi:MAG: 3-phosphoshikimate 1-carboxyvinyltransferase [Clostridiales bacterium]|nr:3-phosphoshikimate 1-carboxyvinyltransferase [Clostridiales bacterium]
MNVKLVPTSLSGRVDMPASKSYAHRMLITAAFSNAESVLIGDLSSDDLTTTMLVLTAFGARFNAVKGGMKITPAVIKKHAVASCGESGSTLRFAVPIAAALGIETTFVGALRLGERPMQELLDCLVEHGVKVLEHGFPFSISGKLSAGDYVIDGSRSSQFVSGLLLALPLLDGDSTLTVRGTSSSAAYIDITVDVLRQSGVQINRQGDTYFIRGGGYSVAGERKVEGDWSNAAFWMVGGLLGDEISIGNLNPDSLQGDMRVLELLRQAGGDMHWSGDRLIVKRSALNSISFDADGIPDSVPAMAVALAAANGASVITGVKRLRIKESDRLATVTDMLKSLGVFVEYDEAKDTLMIIGVPQFDGGKVFSHNDHRLAMAGAVAAAHARSAVTVVGAEAVKKSYPKFFLDYEILGGSVCRLHA